MAKAHLKLVTPTAKKRAVAPLRRPNSEFRRREHLTETEVEKLIDAARDNRYGHRDSTHAPGSLTSVFSANGSIPNAHAESWQFNLFLNRI